MPTRSLIAFTGGLDSTYVLHEELKKGHNVEVVYAYVLQGESGRLAELTDRRRILNHFKNLFPGQIKEEWIVPHASMSIMQMTSKRRPQLVQQYNTMNALIQVMLQNEKEIAYRPMTGWHHLDVLEHNPSEGQSEETYQLYKDIFKSLVRSMDLERAMLCNLLTPAWDVSKQEMWASLDEWTRANITVSCRLSQYEHRNRTVTLTAESTSKIDEYRKIGLSPIGGTTTHLSLLTPLDRYFLGAHANEGDGMCSIFGECKKYYTTLQPVVLGAVNLDRLEFIQKIRVKTAEIIEIVTANAPELELVSNS